jgi:ribosomal protein S18 acetylase RimI-like enzyme
MNIVDWATASADVVAQLFERERRHWLDALQWDPLRAWREVEQARTAWGLPGLLALDDAGRTIGWLFYLPEDNRFDIGGLTAESAPVTAALLDAVLARAQSAEVAEVRCFVYASAPNLTHELEARGFCVEPYLYLSAALPLGSDPRTRAEGEPRTAQWEARDVSPVSLLLREAYGAEAQLFAPHGTVAEWSGYLQSLVQYGACGDLNRLASRVLRIGGEMVGAAIVTAIAPKTAHLAQFAVHPGTRRKGIARQVLREALGIAAAQGFTTATLLVAENNAPARGLYESLDFQQRGTFLSAGVRVESKALAVGVPTRTSTPRQP